MNKKTFIIIFVSLLGLSLAIYQYVNELQAEFVGAYSASKPSYGHSWTEMQCGGGLCVSGDKVGIGGDPSTTDNLKVTGNASVTGNFSASGTIQATGNISSSGTITATTDVCNGKGACLSQLNAFVGAQNLITSSHTFNMCTTTPDNNGYGEVVNVGTTENPVWICKFDRASCPPGQNGQPDWKQHKCYSATGGGYCCVGDCTPGCCQATLRGWSNDCTAPSSCTAKGGSYVCGDCGCQWTSGTCTAVISQIGCY